ncbi:MAG: hypothetical protein ACFFDH_00070 [Promethearchaeota archaeon]
MDKVRDLINADIAKAIKDVITELAAFLTGDSTQKLADRVYSQPESPTYRRTGNALRGRENVELGTAERKVRRDTTIAGASKNYSPFLNRNSRTRRLNTLFWDDAVKETRKLQKKLVQEKLQKAFKNKLKQ